MIDVLQWENATASVYAESSSDRMLRAACILYLYGCVAIGCILGRVVPRDKTCVPSGVVNT